MYLISEEQIDYIINDISARGVKMEGLQQSILDHVCCLIEQNLEANGDFKSFYLNTIETFYKKELYEIEEETILLITFKNYYTMKKVMIASGLISTIAFLFGSLFKIMHWPGAAALIFLGVLVLSLFFLPLLFILKLKEINTKRDQLILGVGVLTAMMYFVATLFIIMHWPGAIILLLITLSILAFIFIPAYFFTGIRKAETRINTIISTILLVALTTMQFTLISLKKKPFTEQTKRQSTNTKTVAILIVKQL